MNRIFRTLSIAALTLINFSAALAHAQVAAPARALVYKGAGSCEEDCSESSAAIAKLAGFEPIFVGPTETDPAIFEGAAIWIQPGGVSSTAAKAMDPLLKDNIRAFIAKGGGYVGFCAGAFLSTAIIGSTKNEGLGIMPGRTVLYESKEPALTLDVSWEGHSRHLYWEGGPFFKFEKADPVEITATYADGTVASARSTYGKGRVYVTGPHPEAPQYWRDYFKLTDPDGLDDDLAVDMILWATKAR